MSGCVQAGCERAATNYLRIKVPPYGYPVARGVALSLGLELCREHAAETKASDLLGVDLKQKLREITRIISRSDVPLDFTRAKIEVRSIGDAEWQLLKGQRA